MALGDPVSLLYLVHSELIYSGEFFLIFPSSILLTHECGVLGFAHLTLAQVGQSWIFLAAAAWPLAWRRWLLSALGSELEA